MRNCPRKHGRLVSRLAAFLAAVAIQPLLAQEMPSRINHASAPVKVTLRSASAPLLDVRIAPGSRQLLEAAQSAAFSEGTVPPPAKSLGILAPRTPSLPLRVGAVLPSAIEALVPRWESQPDGSHVSHIRITSVGAQGIRARLRLPAGMTAGEMRVVARYGDAAAVLPLPVSRQGEIWTPYTEGETQIVEIQSRENVAGSRIEVVDIGHFELALSQFGSGEPSVLTATGPGTAGKCSPDVVCTANNAVIDAALEEGRKSVALMNFASNGSLFVCTGTLINSPSRQEFFITANHCIATVAEAASLATTWFYQASVCGVVSSSGQQLRVAGGAELLFTNQFVDSTLLRLNSPPPTGAVYSAWNAAPLAANSSVLSISHPSGDYMKFATGTLSSLQNRNDGLIRVAGNEQELYAVLFSRGVIEGGSSGSGLFSFGNGSAQLRGVLSSSTTRSDAEGLTCSNPNENANYGRFDYFYPQIAPLLNGLAYPADDYPNQPTLTGPATIPGTTVSGTLSYVGDIDVFRIPVTQAGTLFVKSSGGYDLIGNLMDASGNTLLTNDDNFNGNNEFGISWRVSPGTYYLAVAAWDPSVVTTTGYQVSTTFTIATTNFTSLWWGGESQSGWGVNVNHQGNKIFATMFNFEAAGLGTQNPGMWLASTGARIGTSSSFSGDLLRVKGPAFNASPFTPITASSSTRVGNMRFDFTGANTATLTYDVTGDGTGGTGATVTKSITRQAFATLPVCEFSGSDRSFAFNYQDLWWNPAESGWGINFTHQSDTIFATLFTYEAGAGTANKGLWLTATMSKSGGAEVFQGDLLRVTGSAFNANPFIPINAAANTTRVGNMRVEFIDGNSAKLTYDVNGQPVTKTIERQVFDELRPECSAP